MASFGTSMMGASPGAMYAAARSRMAVADQALKALNDPMTLAIEHGVQFMTFAAAGYVSGRYSNPKAGPVPYELVVAAPAYALAVASMVYGGNIPGGPIAGRIADQVGTIMLGTYLFKFSAGLGKSHASPTAAPPAVKPATAGFSRREIVGAGFSRREIMGATGMGALSADEAARLSR